MTPATLRAARRLYRRALASADLAFLDSPGLSRLAALTRSPAPDADALASALRSVSSLLSLRVAPCLSRSAPEESRKARATSAALFTLAQSLSPVPTFTEQTA